MCNVSTNYLISRLPQSLQKSLTNNFSSWHYHEIIIVVPTFKKEVIGQYSTGQYLIIDQYRNGQQFLIDQYPFFSSSFQ